MPIGRGFPDPLRTSHVAILLPWTIWGCPWRNLALVVEREDFADFVGGLILGKIIPAVLLGSLVSCNCLADQGGDRSACSNVKDDCDCSILGRSSCQGVPGGS